MSEPPISSSYAALLGAHVQPGDRIRHPDGRITCGGDAAHMAAMRSKRKPKARKPKPEPKKRALWPEDYRCGACGELGHNRRTCRGKAVEARA